MILTLCILIVSIISCSSVTLTGNAYQNISVVISSEVAEDPQLIDSIKELFHQGSQVLFEATRKRVFFSHVIIVIPSSWKSLPNAKRDSQKLNSLEDADIRVDHPHPYYGDRPYTLQPGSCGQSGQYIHLTPFFLRNMSQNRFGPPGAVLVHEWSHYRYGVFDEFGDVHDSRYPLFYYSSDGKIRPNLCPSNIRGWMLMMRSSGNNDRNCSLDENGQVSADCRFYPDPTDYSVKGSLMSIPTQVSAFCDDDANEANVVHDVQAPHPHNMKCGGKSVWKVVSSHPDFVGNSPLDGEVDTAPAFTVIQSAERSTTSFIILIDTSESMAKRLPHLKTALNRMIDLFPEGTRLGVMTFNSNSSMLADIRPLSSFHAEEIKFAIQTLTASLGTDLLSALNQTIQVAARSPDDNLVVILFTDGKITKGHRSLNPLNSAVQQSGIAVNPILFYGNNTAPEIFNAMEQLSRGTGGKLYLAKLKSSIGPLSDVEMSVLDILKKYPSEDRRVVQLHGSSGTSVKKNGSILVDSDIGQKLLFVFGCCHNTSEFHLEVNLTSPSGRQYSSVEGSSFILRNNDSRTLLFKVEDYMVEIGRWTYRLLTGHSTGDMTVSVTGQSIGNKAPKQSITIDSWISRSNLSVPTAVTVLSRLSHGYSPVLNATVFATIDRPTGPAIDVKMTDDGQGADSSSGDGIYSGYFVRFNAAGRYTIAVRIAGTIHTTYWEKIVSDESLHASGGSTAVESPALSVDAPPHEAKSSFDPESLIVKQEENPNELDSWKRSFRSRHIEPFERIDMAGSLRLDQFRTDEDTIPPEQVRDLQLIKVQRTPVHDQVIVHLQWTSAGDDYDYGDAAKEIEVRYSDSPEFFSVFRLGNLVTKDMITHGQLVPQSARSIHKLGIRINLPVINQTHLLYFALTTVDDAHNRADPSNHLQVYIPERPISPGIKTETVILLSILLAITLVIASVCFIHFFSRHVKRRRQNIEMSPRNRLVSHRPRCLNAARRSCESGQMDEFPGFVNYARDCSPPPTYSVVLQTFGRPARESDNPQTERALQK